MDNKSIILDGKALSKEIEADLIIQSNNILVL